MLLLLTDIQWDTDGESIEDCGLPKQVLITGLRIEHWMEDGDLTSDALEIVSTKLSDAWGFCHQGFNYAPFQLEGDREYFPERLGVLQITMPLS